MSREEEAELIAEVEGAKDRLAQSLKTSKALIAQYRAKLGGLRKPQPAADAKPIFRFGEKKED